MTWQKKSNSPKNQHGQGNTMNGLLTTNILKVTMESQTLRDNIISLYPLRKFALGVSPTLQVFCWVIVVTITNRLSAPATLLYNFVSTALPTHNVITIDCWDTDRNDWNICNFVHYFCLFLLAFFSSSNVWSNIYDKKTSPSPHPHWHLL